MGIKRIDAEQAKELLEDDGEFIYVDVRTPDEYQRGHVPGAKNVPYMVRGHSGAGLQVNNNFVAMMQQEFTPEAKLILGCQKGGRSIRACRLLVEEGYTNLHHMRGGFVGETDPLGKVTFPGWTTRGFPVTT